MQLLILILTYLATGSVLSADFTPGCSFAGGQCMYQVKLGHAGQCDTTAAQNTGGGACCDDLTSKFATMKDDLEQLQLKFGVLSSNMASSSVNVSKIDDELQKALESRDDIAAVLTRKESELNTTKAELAKVMAQAATEIKNLRDNLATTKTSLSSCQVALGGVAKPTNQPDTGVETGAYNVTYYSFNQDPPGFTFTSAGGSSSRSYQIERLHTRSRMQSGPYVEHTWGIKRGSYLGIDTYAIAKKRSDTSTATLMAQSPTFPPANAYCIVFWYYMEGNDVKTLDVNIKIMGGTGYPIFTKRGQNQSDKWQLVQIPLDSEYTSFEFQIEISMSTNAYRKQVYRNRRYEDVLYNEDGDIAVDDLYIYATTCDSIPKYPPGAYQNVVNNVTSFYTFHTTPMTWYDAYDTCRKANPRSALVSIESLEEQTFLLNTIESDVVLDTVGQNGYYTSGSDADSEQGFAWTNTGVRQDLDVTNWHLGQPNNVAGNQDCLLMEYPASDYQWGDVNCDTKHPFICEVELPGTV